MLDILIHWLISSLPYASNTLCVNEPNQNSQRGGIPWIFQPSSILLTVQYDASVVVYYFSTTTSNRELNYLRINYKFEKINSSIV